MVLGVTMPKGDMASTALYTDGDKQICPTTRNTIHTFLQSLVCHQAIVVKAVMISGMYGIYKMSENN